MKKINLTLLLFIFIFQSCNNNDCGECFTSPQSFSFEIVDKTSGENLFTNGTYDSNSIEIIDILNNNEPVEFTFISENDINLIQIGAIGWETEIVDIKVSIANNQIFTFYVDAERTTENCCTYTAYKTITISDSEFEQDTQTGIYKILVE